jgi:hypothetical protein
MANLPVMDQETIKKSLPDSMNKDFNSFFVRFDNEKDFVLFGLFNKESEATVTFFNAVAHPRPEDLNDAVAVAIKDEKGKINIGGKIVLDKKDIQKRGGLTPRWEWPSEKEDPMAEVSFKRQPVSGRNAYELREDIIGKAMDVIGWSNMVKNDPDYVSDKILKVAEKLYQFVENKSHR